MGDGSLQMKPHPKKVKVNPGVDFDGLTLGDVPVRKKFKYYCDEPSCEREFYTKSNLANHKRGAHGAERLKCYDSNCTASFVTQSAFYGHMWVKHDIGKGPKCDQCGKKATSVQRLEDHQRSAHGAPRLQCKERGCTKAFTYITDLYKHMQRKHK